MSKFNCPKCKKPGGVPLLNLIAPCDACFTVVKARRRRWVAVDGPSALPKGTICWDGFGTSTPKYRDEIIGKPAPDFEPIVHVRTLEFLRDKQRLVMLRPEEWDRHAYGYFIALVDE